MNNGTSKLKELILVYLEIKSSQKHLNQSHNGRKNLYYVIINGNGSHPITVREPNIADAAIRIGGEVLCCFKGAVAPKFFKNT